MSECDHKRAAYGGRISALTVCAGAEHVHACFMCAICGEPVPWHEGLRVANPPARYRYCDQVDCIEEEAFYHGLPVAEMIQRRIVVFCAGQPIYVIGEHEAMDLVHDHGWRVAGTRYR